MLLYHQIPTTNNIQIHRMTTQQRSVLRRYFPRHTSVSTNQTFSF